MPQQVKIGSKNPSDGMLFVCLKINIELGFIIYTNLKLTKMSLKHAGITGLALFMMCTTIIAQENQDAGSVASEANVLAGKNRIKLNVTSLAMKNVSLQYERVIKNNISAALTVRAMPYTAVPFRNFVNNQISDEHSELKNGISALAAGSFSVTPEVRFYLNSFSGSSGWYLAPSYRYTYARMREQSMLFTNNIGGEVTAKITGTFSANSGGLVFGKQMAIGRKLSLDLWFGPVVGKGKVNLKGVTDASLTSEEMRDIRTELSSWSYPLMNRESAISVRDIGVKYTGLSLGVNAGISVGFCF